MDAETMNSTDTRPKTAREAEDRALVWWNVRYPAPDKPNEPFTYRPTIIKVDDDSRVWLEVDKKNITLFSTATSPVGISVEEAAVLGEAILDAIKVAQWWREYELDMRPYNHWRNQRALYLGTVRYAWSQGEKIPEPEYTPRDFEAEDIEEIPF